MGVDGDATSTGDGEKPEGRDEHVRVEPDRDEGHVARCSCGWTSDLAPSRESGILLHRQHALRARATAAAERARMALDRATHLQASSGRRLADLWSQRARDQGRIDAMRERRVELRLEAMRRLGWAGTPDQRWLGAVLEAARGLSGLDLDELWVAYFAHGGSLSKEQLGMVLQNGRPVGRFDHDVLALTLNEAFDEAGLGRPVDYWDER